MGRYSFLGKDPFLILRGRDGQTVIEKAGVSTDADKPFVETLRDLMNSFQSPFVPGLPRFTGGAVGYLGYDTAAWFEPTTKREGDPPVEPMTRFHDLRHGHRLRSVQHRILLIANARISGDEDLKSLYQFACAKIDFLERELDRGLSLKRAAGGDAVNLVSNMSQETYESIVKKAKEYIAAGDVYQVVLSQRFEAEVGVDAFTVYRALRHVNPSPYMFFIRMGDRSIVGSSPEMLVRVEGRNAQTHPIAGTRPRGRSEEEDMRLAEELKRNEKSGRARDASDCSATTRRVCDTDGTRADLHARRAITRDAPGLGSYEDKLAEATTAWMPWCPVSRRARSRARPRSREQIITSWNRQPFVRRRGRVSGFSRQPRSVSRSLNLRRRQATIQGPPPE